MEHLLQEAFDVVAPALDEALVPPPLKVRLRDGLSALAPVFQVGLEVRLEAEAPQVDVQQAVIARRGHHHVLAHHIGRGIAAAGDDLPAAWHRIGALVRRWSSGADFDWLHEVWLEYDVPRSLTARAVPSVFLNVPTDRSPEEPCGLVERALEELRGRTLPPTLKAHLRTCFDAAPAGAWVSHVGLMLARPVDALRVNVKGLRTATVADLLTRLGSKEAARSVEDRMGWLLRYADHATVCLDIGEEGAFPRVGLEGFFRDPPHEDLRWRCVLDALVDQGVCTPEKRDAVLAWEGIVGPPQVEGPWPGELIAQALLRPDRSSVIARRLNHLKVTVQPGRPLEAKAYLGFGPLWGQLTVPEVPRTEVAGLAAIRHGEPEGSVGRAIERALDFLAEARNQAGWWRDFYGILGTSDEYNTAYVAATLAAVDVPAARALAEEAWQLLAQRERSGGGWGWNACAPPDADSTAWGVRLGRALDGVEEQEPLRVAEAFVRRHRDASGGVACYLQENLPRAAARGWRSLVHTCVTGVAASIPSFGADVLPYLRTTQREDGRWRGYWSDDDEYATGLAAEAMGLHGHDADGSHLQRAAAWAAARIGPAGGVYSAGLGAASPWATAWCVRILTAAGGHHAARQRAVQWLLVHQRLDGSWEGSGRMLVPAPEVEDPHFDITAHDCYVDTERTYTTATVLGALAGCSAADG